MTAHDVICKDFELRLGVKLGRLGQQKSMRDLMAIGFLRVAVHVDLALDDPARLVVEDQLEELAAFAFRHSMIDDERRIVMLISAAQHCATHM